MLFQGLMQSPVAVWVCVSGNLIKAVPVGPMTSDKGPSSLQGVVGIWGKTFLQDMAKSSTIRHSILSRLLHEPHSIHLEQKVMAPFYVQLELFL